MLTKMIELPTSASEGSREIVLHVLTACVLCMYVHRSLSKCFFTASQIFTSLKQFGELSEEVRVSPGLSI